MEAAKKVSALIPVGSLAIEVTQAYLSRLKRDVQRDVFKGYDQIRDHTSRRTYNLGYDYFQMREGDYSFTPIPDYLRALCGECLQALRMDRRLAKDYENIIISLYGPGDRLEAHIDVDFSDPRTDGRDVQFYFGEDVIGLVLETDETGRFYLADAQEQILEELDEYQGCTFLLTGATRRTPYKHGVSPVKDARVSVTFRTVHRI